MSLRDLTQGTVHGVLYRLTAPMFIAVSANFGVAMIEVGFIGQLGTTPLAAVTFTGPVVMMLMSIALGIGIGTSSVLARSVGAGSEADARRIATHALMLVTATMAVLATIGMLTIDPVFRALGAGPDTLPLVRSYMLIHFPSVVLNTQAMVAGNVMRANGNATVPGMVMTGGALLQLLLDPFLIFGWAGLPRLGLDGAAWSMLVARIVTTAVLLRYVLGAGLLLRQDWLHGARDSVRRILHVGLPAIATQLINPVSGAVITWMLARHGEVIVAGYGVAARIEGVAVMVLFALSGSIGPFVGQNSGAGRRDRVHAGVRATYVVSLAWGGLVALPLLLAGGAIAGFVDDNPAVAGVAAFYLAVVPLSYGLWGVLMMASATFNGIGKPLPSTAMSFTRMFILYVPLAWLLDRWLGYPGIFIATTASNALMGVVGWYWLRQVLRERDARARLAGTG